MDLEVILCETMLWQILTAKKKCCKDKHKYIYGMDRMRKNMKNPWEEIELSDYENHMKSDNVLQLQTLNEMMREQFYSYPVKSVMILGIAGGNGLEHIDKNVFEKVYGVDVNQSYLKECAARYPQLADILEGICKDLSQDKLELPYADLLVANLLIEYIGYDCFQKAVTVIKPKYVSCVIQINTDETFVSETPYLHVFDGLDKVHHQMEEEMLRKKMKEIHYKQEKLYERVLPNGKKLVRMDFRADNS